MYKHPSEMWESESKALRERIAEEKRARQKAEENYENALAIIGIIANSNPQREIRIPNQLIMEGMPKNTKLVTYEEIDEYVIAVEDIKDELPR
ncbi:hypothetical protein F400_gp122 [Bacillus phage BCD7]|uniref:Uncharacterized protein n=1 Tax=Bacillus phage BCD7 TaxID=1136534 RepID=J9PVA8_9CAUD|nr:hypothetical protein F400_gp122 [Bacillus phage BCD7]AEZ50569.1 hypothetical protein BCD7_0122 [Bacillus phage BCD7]